MSKWFFKRKFKQISSNGFGRDSAIMYAQSFTRTLGLTWFSIALGIAIGVVAAISVYGAL
jgi:ABC-type amino acid transport system permease subunit